MDYDALAKQFGGAAAAQPQATPSAAGWMEGLSPKDQAELKLKMHSEGRKRITGLDDEIAKANQVVSDLERFGQLNRQTSTGGLWENIAPTSPLFHGDDVNEMVSIQSRLGPNQRVVGSGSSSDRDVNLFMSGLPRVENTGDVNRNIREEFKKRYDYAVKKKTAMESYLNTHGNLNGFDDEWSKTAKPAEATTPTGNSGGNLQSAAAAELARRRGGR